MSKHILIKIVPVLGSIVLFLAWVFQQTYLGDANSSLARIDTAQSVFQTYQSNNAIFNAVSETVKNDGQSMDRIRRSQIYNYELGLRALEGLLDAEAKQDIPPPPHPFDGSPDADTMMRTTQARTEAIQGKVIQMREDITSRKRTLNTLFLGLYAVGSLIVVMGSAANTIISSKAAESPARPSTK